MKQRIMFAAALVACSLAASAAPAAAFEGFRGATWGDLRGALPADGEDNLLMNGWIRQGVDWRRWGNTTLNTYATVRYKWDTLELDYNNSVGPGIGIAVDTYRGSGLAVSVGAEYVWDRYFTSGRTDETLYLYLGWYGWWDLKRDR